MRRKIITAIQYSALLAGAFLLTANGLAQDQPVSAPSLGALEADQQRDRKQLAEIQTEELTILAQINALQQRYDSYIDPVQNPGTFVAGQTAKGALQGQNPIDTAYATLVAKNELYNQIKGLKAQLTNALNREAQLEPQIAARQRTIDYYRNPLQGDIDNENARLRILQGQKATADDDGQLGRDIQNTQSRINELEKQFQQGGGGSSGPSSGQAQPPSYGAPAGTSGTGPQSQLPLQGYVTGYIGAPPVYGAPVPPRWTDLNPPGSRQHSAGASAAGTTGGGTGPSRPGAPPPIAQAPGSTQTPPASGAPCSQPICYRPGQTDCDNSVPISIPVCYRNMLLRCNQGEAGGTGGWCVHKGADASCEARAHRVCEEASQQGVWGK